MTLLQKKREISKMQICSSSNEDEITDEIKSENESLSEKESNDDVEINESDVKSEDDQSELNTGWVDSISKILKTNKPKKKRNLILSKAKKLTDLNKSEKSKEIDFEIDGKVSDEEIDEKNSKESTNKKTDEPKRKKRKENLSVRIKPNVLEKDRERTLSKIATKGVVQLFNSVRMQQKDIHNKLKEAGPLERKREKVMKNIDKRAFLDVLMQKKSEVVDKNNETAKMENGEKGQTTWNVLRDNFMLEANVKDWDKQIDEDETEIEAENFSDSD